MTWITRIGKGMFGDGGEAVGDSPLVAISSASSHFNKYSRINCTVL